MQSVLERIVQLNHKRSRDSRPIAQAAPGTFDESPGPRLGATRQSIHGHIGGLTVLGDNVTLAKLVVANLRKWQKILESLRLGREGRTDSSDVRQHPSRAVECREHRDQADVRGLDCRSGLGYRRGASAAQGKVAPGRPMCARSSAMGKTEKLRPVFVVYTAPLFDGWEVVKEGDDESVFFGAREDAISYAKARAAMGGGALVKLENWFGDVQAVWEVAAPSMARLLTPPRRLIRETPSASEQFNHAAKGVTHVRT